jgi:serine phosphatase RsbU (regulator of sigma subunit)
VKLEHDDIVTLYTEGITEARNEAGEMLHADGLIGFVRALTIETPALMAKGLLAATHKYRAGAPRDDDESFMIVRHTQG